MAIVTNTGVQTSPRINAPSNASPPGTVINDRAIIKVLRGQFSGHVIFHNFPHNTTAHSSDDPIAPLSNHVSQGEIRLVLEKTDDLSYLRVTTNLYNGEIDTKVLLSERAQLDNSDTLPSTEAIGQDLFRLLQAVATAKQVIQHGAEAAANAEDINKLIDEIVKSSCAGVGSSASASDNVVAGDCVAAEALPDFGAIETVNLRGECDTPETPPVVAERSPAVPAITSHNKIIRALEQEFGGPLMLHGFPDYSKPRPAGTTFVSITESVPSGHTNLVLMGGYQGPMVKVTSAFGNDTIPLCRRQELRNKEALPNMPENLFVLLQAVAIAHAQRQVPAKELAGAVNGKDIERLFRKVAGLFDIATERVDAAEQPYEQDFSDCEEVPVDFPVKRPCENSELNPPVKRLRANSVIEIEPPPAAPIVLHVEAAAGQCAAPVGDYPAIRNALSRPVIPAPVPPAIVSSAPGTITQSPAFDDPNSAIKNELRIAKEILKQDLLECFKQYLNGPPLDGDPEYALTICGLDGMNQLPPPGPKRHVHVKFSQKQKDGDVTVIIKKFDWDKAEPVIVIKHTYFMSTISSKERQVLLKLIVFSALGGARRTLYRFGLRDLNNQAKSGGVRREIAGLLTSKIDARMLGAKVLEFFPFIVETPAEGNASCIQTASASRVPVIQSIRPAAISGNGRSIPQQQQLRRHGDRDARGFLAVDAIDADRAGHAGQLLLGQAAQAESFQE
jgi:hypothetical protein